MNMLFARTEHTRREAELLKKNTNEWILNLVRENNLLRERVMKLEAKAEELQSQLMRTSRF